jgi:hypothetical protein
MNPLRNIYLSPTTPIGNPMEAPMIPFGTFEWSLDKPFSKTIENH